MFCERAAKEGTQNRVEIRCSYYHTRSSSSFQRALQLGVRRFFWMAETIKEVYSTY